MRRTPKTSPRRSRSAGPSLRETPVTDDAGVLAAVGRLADAALGDKPLTYKNTATVESAVRNGLTDTIDALSKRIARAAESTVRQMADFRNKYPNETTDIDASLEAAADYNRLLEQLVGNDLPRFEAQFKESLNQNTIHEVVAFNAFLDSRRQDIVEPDRRDQPVPGRDSSTTRAGTSSWSTRPRRTRTCASSAATCGRARRGPSATRTSTPSRSTCRWSG